MYNFLKFCNKFSLLILGGVSLLTYAIGKDDKTTMIVFVLLAITLVVVSMFATEEKEYFEPSNVFDAKIDIERIGYVSNSYEQFKETVNRLHDKNEEAIFVNIADPNTWRNQHFDSFYLCDGNFHIDEFVKFDEFKLLYLKDYKGDL